MFGRGIALVGSAVLGMGIGCTGLAYASTPAPAPALVVTVDAGPMAGIYPGASRPVRYTVSNAATDRSVALHDPGPSGRVGGALSVDRAHAGCDPAWFSFRAQGDEGATYAPGVSSTYTGVVEMVNAPVNQDACKGATISLTVTIAG